jgi:hypothetical protein
VDDRQNFINNEVATDYNAGFTALLCKMIDKYGGTPDPKFPEKETHDSPEFYVEALDKGSSSSGMTVSFKITNHSAWHARVQDNISCRYFMDMSEVIAAGKNPEDIVVRCDRDQAAMYSGKGIAPAQISKPIQYDGNIYYVEITLPDGRAVLPVSEGMQQCEILLAFVMPDYGSGWDAENDYSNKDILGKKGEADAEGSVKGYITPYIPTYVNGELYYGIEPDGTSADGMGGADIKDDKPDEKPVDEPADEKPTETTVPDDSSKIVYGDANLDGKVSISDAVRILQYIANGSKYALEKQAVINADIDGKPGVTGQDASEIQKYDAKIINKFPVEE